MCSSLKQPVLFKLFFVKFYTHFLLSILVVLLCQCGVNKKVIESLKAHEGSQGDAILSLTRSIDSIPQKNIRWNQAIERIQADNLEYLRSQDQVEHTLKSQNRTWWTLAPEIFTFVNISKSLTEISDLSKDDISFSIIANITIPNPFQFYAQLYADKLSMLAAEWGHETTRRDFHVRLYSYYIQQQNIDRAEKRLRKLQLALEQNNSEEISSRTKQLQTQKLSLETQKEQFRVQLNQLFSTPGENWRLTDTPPNISYADKVQDLSLETGYGKLGLMLQTLQIESNILTLWNAKVSRWPQLSIGLSNPPLVSSSSSSNQGFDPEQTKLFSGASHGIKINDPLSTERLKKAEVRAQYVRKQLLLTTESDASRLFLLKKRYKFLVNEERVLQAKLKTLNQNLHSTQSPSLVSDYLVQQKEISDSLRNNRIQQTQFDLQLWVWDEAYWKKY